MLQCQPFSIRTAWPNCSSSSFFSIFLKYMYYQIRAQVRVNLYNNNFSIIICWSRCKQQTIDLDTSTNIFLRQMLLFTSNSQNLNLRVIITPPPPPKYALTRIISAVTLNKHKHCLGSCYKIFKLVYSTFRFWLITQRF